MVMLNKTDCRLYAIVILTLLIATVAISIGESAEESEADSSGPCGDGLTYTIEGTKLTISKTGEGTGTMADYSFTKPAPWYGMTLTQLVLSPGVTSIGDYAFVTCSGLSGNLIIPSTVTSIRNNAFDYCTGFTGTLTIPGSVKTIGEYAFYNCTGFSALVISEGVGSIGMYAFSDCTGFTGTLSIPGSVKTIGDSTFNGCTGFSALVISEGVGSIGRYAFSDCTGFTSTLSIPGSVKTIGERAFYNCTGFSSLTIREGVEYIGDYSFLTTDFKGSLTIPSTVYRIGNSAFCSAGFDGHLTIREGIKSIGDFAFVDTGFSSLTISYGVESIGIGAFNNCTEFKGDLTIPGSVKTIGISAFNYCIGFDGHLTIREGVESIGESAFSSCSGFKGDLTIPGSVKTIGDNAFASCYGFTGNLTIREGITSIGNSAFQNTGFTGTLTIPGSVKTIGDNAFASCSGFAGNLIIPSTVNTIGAYAFNWCTGFSSLTIREGVKTIGSSAFAECSGFKGSLIIPSSVTEISDYTFMSCMGFNGSLSICDGVTSIGEYAFVNCPGFTGTLNIPSTVQSIGGHAFDCCSNITGIVIQPGLTSIGDSVFASCGSVTTLVIGKGVGCVSSSVAFSGWTFDGSSSAPSPGKKYTGTGCNMTSVNDVCDVVYIFNNGSGESLKQCAVSNEPYTIIDYPVTKPDYVLLGWSDGVGPYAPGQQYQMGSADVTFKAIWVLESHTVKYDVNGGTGSVSQQSVQIHSSFTLPSYSGTKAGYVFAGWNDGYITYVPGTALKMGHADQFFKAEWIKVPNCVSYDVNGGTGSVPDQLVNDGKEFPVASYTGTKAGFNFAGWNDGSVTYQPGDSYTMGSSDVQFTAVWVDKPSHFVTYDVNGGTGSVPGQVVKEDMAFTVASYSGTKAGFKFGGWALGSDTYQPSDSCAMGDANISFVAVWIGNPVHDIVYNVNGGTGSVLSQTAKEGEAFTVASYSGTKAGFNFAGWSDGYAVHQPGESFIMGSSDILLTAVWTDKPVCSAAYDVNGGTGSVPTQTVEEGANFIIASYSGTKAGFNFAGWNDGVDTYQPGDSYIMGSSDIQFTAVWIGIITHDAVYNVNGGTGSVPTQTVEEGNEFIIASYSGTKAGFSFAGWNDGIDTYLPGDSYVMGESDVSFVAVWIYVDSCRVSYDLDGGTGSVQVQYVKVGDIVSLPSAVPEKSGCTFDSWMYGGKTYSSGSNVTVCDANMVFKAMWIEDSSSSDEVLMYCIIAVIAVLIAAMAAIAFVTRRS